jgi:hypothetical protein
MTHTPLASTDLVRMRLIFATFWRKQFNKMREPGCRGHPSILLVNLGRNHFV